jgi:hypothetical protein
VTIARYPKSTERCTIYLRSDIKAALRDLCVKKGQEDGGYISLGQMLNNAALLLLAEEGVNLMDYPSPIAVVKARKPSRPRNKVRK